MMSVVVVSHLIMHIRGTACHLLQQCRYVLWCYDATPLMLAIMEKDVASMSLGTTRPFDSLGLSPREGGAWPRLSNCFSSQEGWFSFVKMRDVMRDLHML